MDNQKGGQKSTAAAPSWNAWSRAAGMKMEPSNKADKTSAGELTSLQKQQQTATALARKKVLEAYKTTQKQEYKEPTASSPVPKVTSEDWRKYHSAWQNYYQKYYGEYYGKAAQEYVAREKMKMERDRLEKERKAAFDRIEEEQKEEKKLAEVATASQEEVEEDFRSRIRKKAAKRATKSRKVRRIIPLAIGILILLAGLFLQYNQVIIAHAVAYMSPGGTSTNDITAIDSSLAIKTHKNPYLMVPKLNIEVPITFGAKTDVHSMNVAMLNGVANFKVAGASAKPGEIGNFVISGHSAGNVYQQGDYKFIFSGLTRMEEGDLIYVDYNQVRYTYRVTGTKVVNPSDVAALRKIAQDNEGKPMITLLTCTPLGTSKYRLLVFGEQIAPSYEGATESPDADPTEEESDIEMPSGDPSPLEQLWRWLTGQS